MSSSTVSSTAGVADHHRVVALDGWRGVSISLVLAAHLLPLGPGRLMLNATAGAMGMSIFFTLSGYLITTFLLSRPEIDSFLIRRLLRILPLAWAVLLLLVPVSHQTLGEAAASFLFYQNYHYASTTEYNSHFWSLCVEMQFYLGAALIVGMMGRRGLRLLPIMGLLVSAYRIYANAQLDLRTHARVDEILAGATLALACSGQLPARLLAPLRRVPPPVFAVLLFLTSLPMTGRFNGVRAWAGAMLVGSTLLQPQHWMARPLRARVLAYLATISYALYVLHGPLRAGWFAEGNTVGRYLIRRPITFALTFALAHLSTFYWESRWIELGRRLTRKRAVQPATADAQAS